MPEGPECRLTIEYLNRTLQHKLVTDWVFSGGKYTEEYPEGFSEFDLALPLTVKEVSCKGKFIYFILTDDNDEEYYILHSLMMTGRWQKQHDEYCKWYIEVDNGCTLWFRDPRGFATLKFTTNKEVLMNKLEKLGPDIMRSEFELPFFKDLIQKYLNRNITAFLMDQEVISGCGNYIKAEVLYYAKISPLRKMVSLTLTEMELLYEALRVVSRLSYNHRGVSIRDFADEDGQVHYYSKNLKIYGQKTAKRTKTADGRTTYWDPEHQL